MLECKICGHKAENSLQAHINHKHGLVNKQYKEMYPESPIYSKAYCDRLVYTNAHRDPSYKKKLSENTKRLYKDSEWVCKHNKALKRAQNTEEAKRNHRKGVLRYFENRSDEQALEHNKSLKESWKDPNKRENRVNALQKAHRSLEGRKNHSKATKAYYDSLTDEQREKKKKKLKEVWAQPENRKKLMKVSEIGLKAAMSPKGRDNFLKAQRKPEVREKRRKLMQKRMLNQPTISSLNLKFLKELNKLELKPETEVVIGPYMVDFYFPSENLVIETDGDFWHGNPELYLEEDFHPIQIKTAKKDIEENSYMKKNGFHMIRFWETDINKDMECCLIQVQEKLNELRR